MNVTIICFSVQNEKYFLLQQINQSEYITLYTYLRMIHVTYTCSTQIHKCVHVKKKTVYTALQDYLPKKHYKAIHIKTEHYARYQNAGHCHIICTDLFEIHNTFLDQTLHSLYCSVRIITWHK